MESTEQQRSELSPAFPPDPPRNAHLYCPHCDYDLTGAPTNRCPECGNEFDVDSLAAWQFGSNQPLPASSFLALARMSLFDPVRLGLGVSPSPDLKSATGYAIRVRGLAALVVAIGSQLWSGSDSELVMALLVAAIVAISSHVCEVALSLAFRLLVRGRTGHVALAYSYWRTLTACFSTHLLVSCGLTVVVGRLWLPLFSDAGWLLLVPTMGWWWYSLGRALTARTEPTAGRLVAVLLIPVVGVTAIFFGFALGFVVVAMTFR